MKHIFTILLAIIIAPTIIIAQSSPEKKKKKLRIKPVFLVIEVKAGQDSSVRSLFNEALVKNGVSLLNQDELNERVEVEKKGFDNRMHGKMFSNPEDVKRAADAAWSYAANMLTIDIVLDSKDGQSFIKAASWKNVAMPVNPHRTTEADLLFREIKPGIFSGNLSQQVDSIVNEIIQSKKLE